jgi:hypothetical protein
LEYPHLKASERRLNMRTISEQTKQRWTVTLTQAFTLVLLVTLTLTLSLDHHLSLTQLLTLTECRLLREADAKYGWQLQKRSKEVVDVKLQAQSRIGRLVTQKKTLSSELKAVTRSKHEAVAVLYDEVKELRKSTKDQLNTVHHSHRDAVAKLEEEKADFRQRLKGQRAEYKERVANVASRNEALERLCTKR